MSSRPSHALLAGYDDTVAHGAATTVATAAAFTQYGALPFETLPDDEIRVLLVTSRQTRRWIIPKGWPERNLAPHEVAAKEAQEEAGAKGRIAADPIGTYRYRKRLRDGSFVACDVLVFPLAVRHLQSKWPEARQRERRWVGLSEAAMLVEEPGLVTLLLSLQG